MIEDGYVTGEIIKKTKKFKISNLTRLAMSRVEDL